MGKYSEAFRRNARSVLGFEGGFADHKEDVGGATNFGIASKFNKGVNVKKLDRQGAIDIYYNKYWKPSGAENIKDPDLQKIHFDSAILFGVTGASKFLKQANGDPNKYIDLRQQHHVNRVRKDPSQKKFFQGWTNRNNNLRKGIKKKNIGQPRILAQGPPDAFPERTQARQSSPIEPQLDIPPPAGFLESALSGGNLAERLSRVPNILNTFQQKPNQFGAFGEGIQTGATAFLKDPSRPILPQENTSFSIGSVLGSLAPIVGGTAIAGLPGLAAGSAAVAGGADLARQKQEILTGSRDDFNFGTAGLQAGTAAALSPIPFAPKGLRALPRAAIGGATGGAIAASAPLVEKLTDPDSQTSQSEIIKQILGGIGIGTVAAGAAGGLRGSKKSVSGTVIPEGQAPVKGKALDDVSIGSRVDDVKSGADVSGQVPDGQSLPKLFDDTTGQPIREGALPDGVRAEPNLLTEDRVFTNKPTNKVVRQLEQSLGEDVVLKKRGGLWVAEKRSQPLNDVEVPFTRNAPIEIEGRPGKVIGKVDGFTKVRFDEEVRGLKTVEVYPDAAVTAGEEVLSTFQRLNRLPIEERIAEVKEFAKRSDQIRQKPIQFEENGVLVDRQTTEQIFERLARSVKEKKPVFIRGNFNVDAIPLGGEGRGASQGQTFPDGTVGKVVQVDDFSISERTNTAQALVRNSDGNSSRIILDDFEGTGSGVLKVSDAPEGSRVPPKSTVSRDAGSGLLAGEVEQTRSEASSLQQKLPENRVVQKISSILETDKSVSGLKKVREILAKTEDAEVKKMLDALKDEAGRSNCG